MAQCVKCGKTKPEGAEVCPCSCYNCEHAVFNHVLAYTQSYLNNNSALEVSKALEIYFSNDEMASARNILREKFGEQLSELDICKVANRKSSLNRSVLGANANDVVEAVYHLMNGDPTPQFVTLELHRLPMLTPVLASTNAQAESILLLEKKFQHMEQKMQEHYDLILQNSRDLANRPQAVRPSAVRSAVEQATPNEFSAAAGNKASYARSLNLPPPLTGFGSSGSKPTQQQAAGTSQSVSLPENSIQPPKHQPVGEAQQQPSSDQPWEIQHHMKRRLRRASADTQGSDAQQRKPRRRTPPLQGSALNTEMKAGAGPSRDLWIFNVHKDMDDNDLRGYVEDGGGTKERKVNIRSWEARYNDEQDSKQFRLTISKQDYDYVYKTEFWPKDISVRKYYLSAEDKAKLRGFRSKVNDGGANTNS